MKFKVTQESRLYSRRFTAVAQNIESDDGRSFVHETLVHPGAVVVIPLLSPSTVVLVKQYRPSIGEWIIEFPAGTLEVGELPVECAKREIIEEVFYEAGQIVDLGFLYPAPGFCTEKQYLFVASNLKSCSTGTRDDDEVIEILEWSVEKLETEIRDLRITDAKTIAAFCRARLQGVV